jgi:hypothetical protein
MCALAAMNQLRVNKEQNCNVQPDQRCCGFSDTLQAQERFAAVTFYQFVANEKDMYDAMDHQHYTYMVVLRQSQDRYRSHWKHMCQEQYHTNVTLPTFDAWWQAQPDNWNFRKICGTRCQNVPKYQVNLELFQYTMKRLNSFDHILLLEYWDAMLPQFTQSLGWRTVPNLHISAKAKNITYPALGSRDWDPFMSILDDALYEFGLARYRGISVDEFRFSKETARMLDHYFSMGRERGCGNPCCAESCSTYR